MKPIDNSEGLATDYPSSECVIIEQVEYEDRTSFWSWGKERWDNAQKKIDYRRAAYFIVRPKSTTI